MAAPIGQTKHPAAIVTMPTQHLTEWRRPRITCERYRSEGVGEWGSNSYRYGAAQPGDLTMKAYRYLTGKDDAAFCHRVTEALNNGWQLYGQPTLTFDQKRGEVICGQAITKELKGKRYNPELDLSTL